jgi:hypothetical protein
MTILEKKLAIAFLATAVTGAGITMSELAANAAPAQAAIVHKVDAPRARAAQPDDVKTYAAREAGAQKQLDYKGGDMVVIGLTTTGVIVLLVVALLLL